MKKVACFTAHRPSKFAFKYNESDPRCVRIKETLLKQIEQAIQEGYTDFISGMALGGDTWAAEAVLELKEFYPHIRLICAIPCKDQERMWPEPSKKRYRAILEKADEVVHVSEEPYKAQLMILRDIYMVDRSSLLIAIFDGSEGGTKHTFDYAMKKGIEIWRIIPESCEVEVVAAQLKILECHSKGDKRFSALYAQVEVFRKLDTIENHYQKSKRFGSDEEPNPKDAKGKSPTHLFINGKRFDAKHLSAWYKYLWILYLGENPDLEAYVFQFDDFRDIFKGKSVNCQADVIRQFVKEGPAAILAECAEFLEELAAVAV